MDRTERARPEAASRSFMISPGLSLAAARAPFLSASVLTGLLGCAWVWSTGQTFSWPRALLALLGIASVHLAANTANDYYDWNGSDAINQHAGPFSGGSRHRLDGKVPRSWFAVLTLVFLVLALASGLALVWLDRPHVLTLGIMGAAGGLLYSTKPIQLQARGLGEFDILVMFGPLTTLGTSYAITGTMDPAAFVIGIPAGILTTAILWANEIPDMDADQQSGKQTLVVRLGKDRAWWGLTLLVTAWVGTQVSLWAAGILPAWSLLALLPIPLAIQALRGIHANLQRPKELVPFQGQIIMLQALSVGTMALALVGFKILG